MEFKGQGAIEYLLIIGAAILVVAIVILAVTGALSGGQDTTTAAEKQANINKCLISCSALGDCTDDAGCAAADYADAAKCESSATDADTLYCKRKA